MVVKGRHKSILKSQWLMPVIGSLLCAWCWAFYMFYLHLSQQPWKLSTIIIIRFISQRKKLKLIKLSNQCEVTWLKVRPGCKPGWLSLHSAYIWMALQTPIWKFCFVWIPLVLQSYTGWSRERKHCIYSSGLQTIKLTLKGGVSLPNRNLEENTSLSIYN